MGGLTLEKIKQACAKLESARMDDAGVFMTAREAHVFCAVAAEYGGMTYEQAFEELADGMPAEDRTSLSAALQALREEDSDGD